MNRQVSFAVTVEITTSLEKFNYLMERLAETEEIIFKHSDELTSHNIENMEVESAVMFDEDDDIDLLK